MADNYTAGGYAFASDDVGGIQSPRVKVQWGADGAASDASASAPLPVEIHPGSSGTVSVFRSLDLDETEEAVKTTAGTVHGFILQNLSTAARYVKFYDGGTTAVAVGTTTAVATFALEGSMSIAMQIPPLPFATAITVAATVGLLDSNASAPGTNEVLCTVFYK